MSLSLVAGGRILSLLALSTLVVAPGVRESVSQELHPQAVKHEVPERKQTTLGLYVTASEAYEKWEADPERVKVLDVRTTEEIIYVGHPLMTRNIPFAIQTYDWDPAKKYFTLKPDPEFVSRVKEVFKPEDTLLIMCRSGDRSALAVNALAKAGFKKAYTILDGMEGDLVEDPANVFHGKRMKDGWKNSGLPWTYHPDPKRMRLPDRQ